MKPPECAVCGESVATKEDSRVHFLATLEGAAFQKSGLPGADPDADWFCSLHLEQARALAQDHHRTAALSRVRAEQYGKSHRVKALPDVPLQKVEKFFLESAERFAKLFAPTQQSLPTVSVKESSGAHGAWGETSIVFTKITHTQYSCTGYTVEVSVEDHSWESGGRMRTTVSLMVSEDKLLKDTKHRLHVYVDSNGPDTVRELHVYGGLPVGAAEIVQELETALL